ncbi:MAG: Ig-like domain-containing protein [Longimicrobiales bacterium]
MTKRKLGILGLAVVASVLAACEGDTVIENPIDTVITVQVLPDTATLIIAQTRQLAAVVNGTANQAVTWSSNAPAATVNATGLVTAVSVGTAVITAVSQADATARDASVINVIAAPVVPPPSIVITSITTGNTNTPVNPQNVVGQIDITAELNVPPGAQVQRVEFLLDNVVQANCTQTFTSTGSEDDLDAAQVPIICSLNTAAHDTITGAVPAANLNGTHTISVRVVQPNGNVVAGSSQPLVFNNQNFAYARVSFLAAGTTTVKACVTAGANARSLGGSGSLWCGGDVRVATVGVNFGPAGSAIATANVSIVTSGAGVSGITGCRSTNNLATDPTIAPADGGAPFGGQTTPGATNLNFPNCAPATVTISGLSATFSSTANPDAATPGVNNIEDVIAIMVNSVTTSGQAGPTCINPAAGPNPITTCGIVGGTSAPNAAFFTNPNRLDNSGPRVTLFDITPNTCETATCYVNAGFAFTAGRAGFYTSVDYGVDSQNASTTFQAGTSATALANVTTAASLDNTATSADLFLRATSADGLGNQRLLFPTAVNTVVQTVSSGPTPQKFGVDKVNPFFTAAVLTPANNGANDGTVFSYAAADSATPPAGPSGININPPASANSGFVTRVEQITPGGTSCRLPVTGGAISCSTGGNQGNGTDANLGAFNIGAIATNAYYRVTTFVRDNATNVSSNHVTLTLLDTQAPGMGGVVAPSIITGNASTQFTTTATDNLDLGDVSAYIGYPAVGGWFVDSSPAPIGTYGPDTFTTSGPATFTIPNFIRSVQFQTGAGAFAGINRANSVTFDVRDQAGVVDNDPCPSVGTPNTSTANCTSRRDDITAAVNAGIPATGGLAETSYAAVAGFTGLFTTNPASVGTVCNGTTQGPPNPTPQPCPTNPTSTIVTASVTGASATFANPFVRVNFYFQGPATGGRQMLIGTGTQTATVDDQTNRTFNWTVTWNVPTGLAPGAYQIFAGGIDSKGQSLFRNFAAVTVAVD